MNKTNILFSKVVGYVKKASVILFTLPIIATLLMIMAFSIPLNNIDKNLKNSVKLIEERIEKPILFEHSTSQIDIFTDSLMLLESSNRSDDSVIKRAMFVYHPVINDGQTPQEMIINHYNNGVEYNKNKQYSRYWHGYLIFLKPLLCFFSYNGVLIINSIVQSILFFLIILFLIRKKMKKYIIPVIISYLLLIPPVIMQCLQFSTCYYIAFGSMLFMLILPKKQINLYVLYLFEIIGILTAFFDYLTFPLITFGLPIVLFFAINTEFTMIVKIYSAVKCGVSYLIGYIGMWTAKIAIGSVLTRKNLFSDALGAVAFRTSNNTYGTEKFSLKGCELANIKVFFQTPLTQFFILFVIIVLILIIIKRIHLKNGLTAFFPYFIISLMPFAWYAVTVNHSSIHFFFTNKEMIIFVFSITIGLVNILQLKSKENKNG